jgi:two-component system response regulator YesN
VRKVLLVDDEKYITKGLRAIIERATTSFDEIYETSNSLEALQRISRENFDLVVLDIRMPDMDGIMLLKEAQKLSVKPKFIILSGYDDFHYAADCIKYGAKAYLLKPVKREELIETLKQVELELSREEELNSAKQKKDILLNYFRVDELNFIFLKDSFSETEVGEILRTLELDILDQAFQIGILAKRGPYNSGRKEYYEQLKMEVYEYFQQTNQKIIVFLDIDGNLVLITAIDANCSGLLESLAKSHKDSYVIGLSSPNHSAPQIRTSYLQACETIKYRILLPSAQIIPYTAIQERNIAFKIPVENIKKIPEITGTSKAEAIEEILDQLFMEEAICSYPIEYFEKIAGMINQYVIHALAEYFPQKNQPLDGKYSDLEDIYCFNDIFDYIRYLNEYLEEINRFLLGLKDKYRDKKEIEAAMEYIQANYAKDLSMTMVANHISLNYSYFSYLFKEQTGLSFVDYLKRLRIEKAKELLQNSDDKIYEVAEKVGYRNPKHFGRVFREITGITPVEYRNKALFTMNT